MPEALARIALAQLLTATGQPLIAGDQLRTALSIAERLGDEGAAAHVRTMLAALEPPA